ncbi:class I SAM-dependent methyltransferase [Fulvivirga sediminis]|uniref:Methyltransferase domain-containing protein n=1 Tax=Fulvivirga sediminis TaxID=2803949 RepID=A0A937K2Q8_9BACT|nr:class I SAM-dependent methyltransferase [Fulvivirga sediminis]MBL3658092.1 methyltransferase domain-containing protein [Fulvivirga sediminis]
MKKLISYIIRFVPRTVLQRVSVPALKVMGLFLRGNNVTCPIVNKSYKKFLPYGRIKPRPNALCPDSLSLERHRLIWLFLKQKTDFFDKKIHFLHIAPEQCFLKPFEAQHGENYITADLVSPLAKVKMDVHNIPFDNNTFDAAMCNHVMEHVEDDIQSMSEICRVLKPGGWAILQVPFFSPVPDETFEDKSITNPRDREKAYGQDDHVRLYGKDYADRLRRAGFEVDENRFVYELPAEQVKKYALPANEIIYLCKKPA